MTITSLQSSRRAATPTSRRSLVLAIGAMFVAPALAAPAPASAPPGGYKEIPWDDLVPEGLGSAQAVPRYQ